MYSLDRLFVETDQAPCFTVAEIGINHMGDRAYAKRLIEKAKEANADGVKFQVFKTENFYNKKLASGAFDLFKSFELSYDEFINLKDYAESLDLVFFGTPLDIDSIDFLSSIGTKAIKVASSDITCEPFLRRVAERAKEKGLYTILSTGFVGLETIQRAVRFFDPERLALLYCVSKYPASAEDFDLRFIRQLLDSFRTVSGFSDHSRDIVLSLGAVSLGAKIIERHFTDNNNKEGADHSMSLEWTQFKRMVVGIRELESALGAGNKKITEFEKKITEGSMRSMYALRDIQKGEVIAKEDVALLRPGLGVTEEDYLKQIGQKSNRFIGAYEKI